MIPELVIADADNTADSRLEEIILLKLEPDEFAVWLWVPKFRTITIGAELYLYNLAPPIGYLPIKLGRLDWNWYCDGLVVFKLIATSFQLHFSDTRNPASHYCLEPGQTLLSILRSLPACSTDIGPLIAIAELASGKASFVRATKTLESFLSEFIVPILRNAERFKKTTTRTSVEDKLRTVRRLSLWTPGTTESDFMEFYKRFLGDADARHLWQISQTSINAVAKGDFGKQVAAGTELASLVPQNSVLAGEAAYFKGEGLRLLADMEPSADRKENLRAEAVEEYTRASAILNNDPRPLRGLGRITELKGNFDGALTYFTIAKGLCLSESKRESAASLLDIAHEILRTSRHFIHCLLDIRETNLASVWHRLRKELELEGYLRESENLHLEHMPKFQAVPDWYYIEWFMGFVFLAKAWGSLDKFVQMQRMLVKALDARRRILGSSTALTIVERANLEWWLGIAKTYFDKCDPEFAAGVNRLQVALSKNDATAVAIAIEEIIGPIVSPWTLYKTDVS